MASAPLFIVARMEKNYYRLLLVLFWSILAGCALVYVLLSWMDLMGLMADIAPQYVMAWSYVAMLATIIAIPLVLKHVKQQQKRIALLGCVLELDTFSYIMLDEQSLGYLTLITLVAMIFVYPKKDLTDEDMKAVEGMEKENAGSDSHS